MPDAVQTNQKAQLFGLQPLLLELAGRPAHMTCRATMQAAALQVPTSQVLRIPEEFDRHWSALAIPMEKAETEMSSERYKLLLSCPSGLLPSQVL